MSRRWPFSIVRCMDTTIVMKRAAAGDDLAWAELVGHHGRTLRAVAARMRIRGADAEDAAQTSWLTLHENIGSIREPEHVGAWLCMVMRRRCLQMLAQQRRERLVDDVDDWAAPDPVPVSPDPDAATLWGLVDRLPDRERMVIRSLFDGSDRSYREVAEHLSMPVGSLGPVRMRALRRLAAMLADAGLTAEDLHTPSRIHSAAGRPDWPAPPGG